VEESEASDVLQAVEDVVKGERGGGGQGGSWPGLQEKALYQT